MMKVYLIVLLVLGVVQACAQQAEEIVEMQKPEIMEMAEVPQQIFIAANSSQVANADETKSQPYRIADATDVDLNLTSSGRWTRTGTNWIWELEIEAETASSLNFGFADVFLSKQAQLLILNTDGKPQGGRFDASNNKPHGQLWTGMVKGRKAIIRLTVPEQERHQNRLTLKKINRGR